MFRHCRRLCPAKKLSPVRFPRYSLKIQERQAKFVAYTAPCRIFYPWPASSLRFIYTLFVIVIVNVNHTGVVTSEQANNIDDAT